ncbi:MAG: flagellar hook-basal body complex protein FliE [Deltaproteobacteria bacterium]|nr:flagellar hook-basal body complex protein FliE [Deltaproteobacteria bacterium]
MSAIQPLDPALTGWLKPEAARRPETAGNFKQSLAQTVQEIDGLQQEADLAIEAMSSGEPKDVHEVMIAMEKAGISLRLMVQVRNKILAAYEDIMRLQM